MRILQRLKPVFTALACLGLAACALPGAQETYRPLDSHVAAAAQPHYPASSRQIYCRTGRGTARFPEGWYAFSDADFILPDSDRVGVALQRKKAGSESSIMGYFDRRGQKILFCPVVEAPPGERIPCASLYALDDDLDMGIRRTLDIPNAMRGGVITCAYDPKALRKL